MPLREREVQACSCSAATASYSATIRSHGGREESERINRVITFGGQSLKGPEGSTALLALSDTAEDRLPAEGNKQVPAKGRAQGVALSFGKGRVVMLGEASQLSAQRAGPQRRAMGMNAPGCDNRQWTLNILHWLSGLLDPPPASSADR